VVADFADGAEAGFTFCDVVGGGASFGDGAGDADAEAGGAEGGYVDHIVAHVGAGGERKVELGGELGEGGEFIGAALDEVGDFELGGAGGGGAGGAAGNPREREAGVAEAGQAEPVEDGEALASVPSEEMRTVPSVRMPSTSMAKRRMRAQRAALGREDLRGPAFDWDMGKP
jgi:hypothetical protein